MLDKIRNKLKRKTEMSEQTPPAETPADKPLETPAETPEETPATPPVVEEKPEVDTSEIDALKAKVAELEAEKSVAMERDVAEVNKELEGLGVLDQFSDMNIDLKRKVIGAMRQAKTGKPFTKDVSDKSDKPEVKRWKNIRTGEWEA
jgi:hypothetical protein